MAGFLVSFITYFLPVTAICFIVLFSFFQDTLDHDFLGSVLNESDDIVSVVEVANFNF
jgi:hypothetical protein